MKIIDFITKLKAEKKASFRLIDNLRKLSYSLTYLCEIKEVTFRGERNAGIKTYKEFLELRSF